MKALLIDAYDSFVYIIEQYLATLGCDTRVVRNDVVDPSYVEEWKPGLIVLGPGPGHPADANYVDLINRFGGRIPLLGVCLGHQAIGLAFGATVCRADHLMHGKTSLLDHDGAGCFLDAPRPLKVTRYHSLIVADEALPSCLVISARSKDDRYIMGLRHKSLPIEAVQFHPESIGTHDGLRLFANFIRHYS